MYKPTTRVLTLLEILQSRGRVSAAFVAEQFGVSTRSVRRYITMLRDLGIPVERTPGPHGGYRLRRGYTVPPLMFTNDEALSVIVGLEIAARLGLSNSHPAASGALAKIERVMPESVRAEVDAVRSVLLIDDTPPPRATDTEIVTGISSAVHQCRRVWIRYDGPNGETARTIEPYGIVQREGIWYVVAMCQLRNDVRVFRLDRVLRYRVLTGTFERPDDIEPQQLVRRILDDRFDTAEVVLLLETSIDEARKRVPTIMAKLEPAQDGVELTCNTGSLDWMAGFIASLPFPVTVRRPMELARRLQQFAEQIASVKCDNCRMEPKEVATPGGSRRI